MKKRAFICADVNFPRGSAGANYIQYFGLALREAGYDVIIISTGKYEKCYYEEGKQGFFYRGLRFIIPKKNTAKGIRYFESHYTGWKQYKRVIEELCPSKHDIILLYFQNASYVRGLRKYANQKNIKIASSVVEYFSSDMFKGKEARWKYRDFKKAVDYEIPKCDLVFPISTYIDNLYKNRECKSVIVPIMADVNEYPKERIKTEKIKFIYPANGLMKDSMDSMLLGLSELDFDTLNRIELHVTNFSNAHKRIEDIFNTISDPLKRETMRKCVILHSWMEYEQLVALYQTMTFLLLIREESQTTLANFPSKVPEAMSYGVIPIVSDVGDYTKYYLHDGKDSIIFKGTNIFAVTQAIKRAINLSNQEVENMSRAAYRTAKEKFDYHNWSDIISSAFE